MSVKTILKNYYPSQKSILGLCGLSLIIGSTLILFSAEVTTGVLFLIAGFVLISFFYKQLSKIPGSGYDGYKEPAYLIFLLALAVVLTIYGLLASNTLSRTISFIICCGIYISIIIKIYKKHFPVETRIMK